MLKSVFENGGFYIGKYETGTMTARTASGDTTGYTAVVQANAYPYNNVTCNQAQSIASGMASGEYTSSLMFGVQWDLVLKYLETKGTLLTDLNSNSTSWGNYNDNLWEITNTNTKYSTNGTSWTSGAYGSKNNATSVLLSTGASSTFSKQGIYDLAGNVYEWTLEYTSISNEPCAGRGGDFSTSGSYGPASYHVSDSVDIGGMWHGFRVSLY